LIETGSADVLFDFDGATINAAGRTMLDQVIANMRGRTFDRLTLTGYTDPLGDAAYNEGLSQRRADAVRNYLLSNGLNGRDIRATGRGEQDPVVELSACPAGASQVSCLAPNRRVVFTFEGLR
jgi:outer membrane protein OmpA-like peptidoglycan-associated protein